MIVALNLNAHSIEVQLSETAKTANGSTKKVYTLLDPKRARQAAAALNELADILDPPPLYIPTAVPIFPSTWREISHYKVNPDE